MKKREREQVKCKVTVLKKEANFKVNGINFFIPAKGQSSILEMTVYETVYKKYNFEYDIKFRTSLIWNGNGLSTAYVSNLTIYYDKEENKLKALRCIEDLNKELETATKIFGRDPYVV